MQLGVCSVYALLMWIIRINPIKLLGLQSPEAMRLPKITAGDLVKTAPVGLLTFNPRAAPYSQPQR